MKSLKIPQQMGLIGKPKAVHRILHIEIPLEQHGAPHLLMAPSPANFLGDTPTSSPKSRSN